MTLRYVYLAGPIAGCTYAEATDWREMVQDDLAPGIVGINPMRLKEWCRQYKDVIPRVYKGIDDRDFLISGEPHGIGARDFFDVAQADMLLVNRTLALSKGRPSWGTAIEMGWAIAHRKPIVLVTDDMEMKQSALIMAHVGWIVPDLDIGVDIVNGVLGAFVSPESIIVDESSRRLFPHHGP